MDCMAFSKMTQNSDSEAVSFKIVEHNYRTVIPNGYAVATSLRSIHFAGNP